MNCKAESISQKLLRASPSCRSPASSTEPPITNIKVSSFDWDTTDFKQRTDIDKNYYMNNYYSYIVHHLILGATGSG